MQQTDSQLMPPRFANGRSIPVAGLTARYDRQTRSGIAALRQRFVPHIGTIPGQIGFATCGVCYNSDSDGGFDDLRGAGASGAVAAGFEKPSRPCFEYDSDDLNPAKSTGFSMVAYQ